MGDIPEENMTTMFNVRKMFTNNILISRRMYTDCLMYAAEVDIKTTNHSEQLTQHVLKAFKAKGHGDVINIGSIAGREGYPGGSIYCATKAAVRAFTQALRSELNNTRIRVIEIDPGQVETEFSVVRFKGDKTKADAVYKGVEALTGQDIAEVIVFAASRRENVVLADVLIFPSHQRYTRI